MRKAALERLLVEHYDPSYRRSIGRNFARVDTARVVSLERGAPEAFASAAQALAAYHL